MNKLKDIRINNGYTQESLAEKLYVDRSTVSKWESGVSMPRSGKLLELCKVLSCTVEDVMNAINVG